jgi:hypothetical protein
MDLLSSPVFLTKGAYVAELVLRRFSLQRQVSEWQCEYRIPPLNRRKAARADGQYRQPCLLLLDLMYCDLHGFATITMSVQNLTILETGVCRYSTEYVQERRQVLGGNTVWQIVDHEFSIGQPTVSASALKVSNWTRWTIIERNV